MMKKIIATSRKKFIGYALCAFSTIVFFIAAHGSAYAASSNVLVDVSDTIAGYSALVTVNNTLKNEAIEVKLTKPSGTEILLNDTTDEQGELRIDIAGYHTTQAGVYHIAARFAEMNENFGTTSDFRVYPGDVSTNRSHLILNRTTAEALSGDAVLLTVQLQDGYGNPIKGHTVSVISSRTADRIERVSPMTYTDVNGSIQFALSSTTSGVSTYAVMDTTSNVTLESRAKVAYLAPSATALGLSRGGEVSLLFASANAQTTGEEVTAEGVVTGFVIEDLPEAASVNESLGMTVKAVDGLGNTVTNYTGTIRFASSDANATLPNDYTFTENDLGMHTFNLAINFATPGTHTVSIMDGNNEELKSEAGIEIGSTFTTTSSVSGATFTLLSPLEGSVSENTITVSGVTSSGLSVEIYDNDNKIATTMASSDGSFSYTTDPLIDGTHSISAKVVDGTGATVAASNSIAVTIDTTPPILDAVTIEPEGDLNPAAPITITLYSEPALSQASIVLNQSVIDVTEKNDQPGVYTATFSTPDTPGSYDLDVILSDQLSNDVSYVKQKTINVTEEQTVVLPAQVTGVTAIAGDGKVTISWEAVTSDTPVTHYKIYYGPSPTGLYSKVDTFDSRITWEVRSLNNNFKYYFVVTAIDEDGDESGDQSVVIASMPKKATTATMPPATAKTAVEVLHSAPPEETPDSGPEMWVLGMVTLVTVSTYGILKKSGV